MQTDGTYELYTNSRTTTTDAYITFIDILPSDEAMYLISGANSYGQSINNLTFYLEVTGKTQCACINIIWHCAAFPAASYYYEP